MKNSEIPVAAWTIKDVLIVSVFILSCSIVFYILTLYLFGDNRTTFRLARYVGAILMAFFPLFWVKKRYGRSKEVLGLQQGRFSPNIYVPIGLLIGVIYSIAVQLSPLKYVPIPNSLELSEHYIDLITLPISISGFATIILTPFSEEIMFRGFIYGYLRKKIGVIFGLFLQAIIFSSLHYKYNYDNFTQLIIHVLIIGLILGILYEKTKSIYPSMICHGVVNYFAIVFRVIKM